jgi:hypothetical protein
MIVAKTPVECQNRRSSTGRCNYITRYLKSSTWSGKWNYLTDAWRVLLDDEDGTGYWIVRPAILEWEILHFVDHASWYMNVMKTNVMHSIFSLFCHHTSTCFGLPSCPSSVWFGESHPNQASEPSTKTYMDSLLQGVYKIMARFEKFIKWLHSAIPPHFHRNVRELLNRVLQQCWIGHAANGDNHIHILYGTNSIIVWMCVMWPRVHTLKDYD